MAALRIVLLSICLLISLPLNISSSLLLFQLICNIKLESRDSIRARTLTWTTFREMYGYTFCMVVFVLNKVLLLLVLWFRCCVSYLNLLFGEVFKVLGCALWLVFIGPEPVLPCRCWSIIYSFVFTRALSKIIQSATLLGV